MSITWQQPIPLEITTGTNDYPIDSLPDLIRNPVVSYHNYGQQPISLIASSALANVSLACQAIANVARDKHLVSPISLYFLMVASSGERKSAVDKAFGQGIREWQKVSREVLEPEVLSAKIVHHAWKAECDGISKQIRKASNNGESTYSLQNQLRELVENEPEIPLMPELFLEDITQEAFTSSLANGWASSSIWSDEAGIVLSGHGMQTNTTKFVATLNRLWDGNPFIAHRKSTRGFTIANRRVTINLMLQPLLLEQLLRRGDGVTRQSGFLARSLVAFPTSSMGTRYYKEPSEQLTGFNEFNNRIKECLDISSELDIKGCYDIPTLSFSAQAKNEWIKYFNSIENELILPTKWLEIQDFASKAPENTARLAALLHLFSGHNSGIGVESVERAIHIMDWHLNEAKRVIAKDISSTDFSDAVKLCNWVKLKGLTQTTPRYLQQFSPLRNKTKRDSAIDILINHKFLAERTVNGTSELLVNPNI